MGREITSSPCSPTRGRPSGSRASTAAPRYRQGISPARTGTSGQPPTNAEHTSVPPLIDDSATSGPSTSWTQRKPSAGSGAPVEPTARSAPRSATSLGRRPSLRQAMRNGALAPNQVVAVSPASRHRVPRSGWPGSPSKHTMVAPTVRPDTR
jgi:hypothetical protein